MKATILSLVLATGCSQPSKMVPGPRPTLSQPPSARAVRDIDDFEAPALWKELASDGVLARAHGVQGTEGRGLELDFDFQGHAGYAGVRRPLPLDLPPNYELSFDLRASGSNNDFQLKLLDQSGENVWWFRRADLAFDGRWRRLVVKKRQVEFAWGPGRKRELQRTASLEFVVAAGRGGQGSIALDGLRLRELPPPPQTPPRPLARASSNASDAQAPAAIDGRLDSAWRSAPGEREPALVLDFGYLREFGGLLLRWNPGFHASRYDLEISDDGASFRLLRRVEGSDGDRDALRLPESQARFLRLTLHAGPGDHYELAELEVEDLAAGATQNAFISRLAQDSARGLYPRAFLHEQSYWTLLAVDAAHESALISEEGMLELGRGGFSIEPFVVDGGTRVSWADVQLEQSLRDAYLPLPSVTWRRGTWRLHVSAFALGEASASELALRYEVENASAAPLSLSLVLAVRPFQVNPVTQALNLVGGVSPIHSLSWDGRLLSVNDKPALAPSQPPEHLGLQSFDGGGFPEHAPPTRGRGVTKLADSTGLASAALVYELHVPPRERVAIGLVASLGGAAPRRRTLAELTLEQERVAAEWREKLNRVSLVVPSDGQRLVDTLRSALSHILMSRDGPMLRPGTRCYARSWIRDGAMMSEALLRLGHEGAAADYLAWYAPHQFESGKVPCCVDARGADPVPENDSNGELLFLASQIYRYTDRRELVARLWPRLESAARYLESLRQSERGEKNRAPERRAFHGLLPPSISHEGYSDRPSYSYWDDFWGLLGWQSAVDLAQVLGKTEELAKLSRQRDEFRADLYASLRASVERHGLTFLPGSADRGDFDATATTIALDPGREQPALPEDLLRSTFERYFREFERRRDTARGSDVYTPYELRIVGSFVRLGWRERAHELLDFFLRDRRPVAWNQWAEVVGREAREPRFIGDMPHAWIASDYIRSVLDLFVYERKDQKSLVLAAGVPLSWWKKGGVRLRNLRTPYGGISYSIVRQNERALVQVRGAAPPGGFALPWPGSDDPAPATLNGKPLSWQAGELHFRELPALIAFSPPNP